MADPKTRPNSLEDRDFENAKHGAPPRPAHEPKGSEGAADTTKTRTDPHTGEPNGGRPDTAG